MRRRSFLGLALLLPFTRRALGDATLPPSGTKEDGSALDGALDRARRSNRPLLVFVVPENDSLKWDRGAAFGELLNHGTDEQLAPLSRVDAIAAPMSALGSSGGPRPADALMALVDTRGAITWLDTKLPQFDPWHRDNGKSWDQRIKDEDAIADRRIAQLARLLRGSLGMPADIAAAAHDVRQRITRHRVPGSHWAHGGGCGTQIEEVKPEKLMPACGMGHVPSKSARFLYFWAVDK